MKPYHCTDCFGLGKDECRSCGQSCDCEECQGTGYNLDLIDWPKLLRLRKRLQLLGATCEWVRDGVWVGRQTLDGTSRFAYRDCLLPGIEMPDDDSRTYWHNPDQADLFLEPVNPPEAC